MFHRFPFPLSSSRLKYRLTKRPSRLTWGTAVVTMLAIAGVAIGASAGTAARRPADPGALSLARIPRPVRAGRIDGQAAALPLAAAAGRAIVRHAPARHSAAQHSAVRHSTARHAVARHALAKHAAAGHAAAGHAAARHAVARHATGRAHSHGRAPARHLRLYRIFDSVNPAAIPAHRAVATYATGAYAVSRAQVAGRRTVFWIDTNGTDPAASILDVEPGDATPSQAAAWAWRRLHEHPHSLARIYTMLSWWPAVRAAVATLPPHMRSHIRWWIADPTGVPHIVPGADATQWYWGHSYDISTAKPRF